MAVKRMPIEAKTSLCIAIGIVLVGMTGWRISGRSQVSGDILPFAMAFVVIMVSFLVVGTHYDLRRERPLPGLTTLCLSWLLWYLLPGLVVLPRLGLGGPVYGYGITARAIASVFVLVTLCTAFSLAAYGFAVCQSMRKVTQSVPSSGQSAFSLAFLFVLLVIGMVPLIRAASKGGASAFLAARAGLDMSRMGDSRSILNSLLHLETVVFVIAATYFLKLVRVTGASRWRLLFLAASSLFIIVVSVGTRSQLVMAMGTLFLLVIQRYWRRDKKTILVMASLVLCAIWAIGAVQVTLRRTGFDKLSMLRGGFRSACIEQLAGADMFSETCICVEYAPPEPFWESPLLLTVLNPIPRALWSEKPFSRVNDFYNKLRMDVSGFDYQGNVLPGFLGQYRLAYGAIGPFLASLLLGYVLGVLECKAISCAGLRLATIYLVMTWIGISFRNVSGGYIYGIIALYLLQCLDRIVTPRTLRLLRVTQ